MPSTSARWSRRFSLNEGGGWALELQGMFLFAALAAASIGPGGYALMER